MGHKIYISSDMSLDMRLGEMADEHPQAAMLWPWFLLAFDDWGRAEATPRRIKAQVFPLLDMITVKDIGTAINVYAAAGLISLYNVDGTLYMYIPSEKWYRYQTHIRGEKRTDDKSHYPAPPQENTRDKQRDVEDSAQSRADARKRTQNCASPSPSLSPSPSPSDPSSEVAVAPPVAASSTPDDSPPKKVFNEKSHPYQLAVHLRTRILERIPDATVPSLTLRGMAPWAKHIDLMIRADHKTPDDIRQIIDFAQDDTFWQNNIMSTRSLRDQFNKLKSKMQGQGNPNGQKATPARKFQLSEGVIA